MSAATAMAVRFVQIVAQVQPHPGNELDRAIVNAARVTARMLRIEGLAEPDLPIPRAPVTASGIPITRRRT